MFYALRKLRTIQMCPVVSHQIVFNIDDLFVIVVPVFNSFESDAYP